MTDPRIVVVNSVISASAAELADYRTQLIIDCNFHTLARVTTYAAGEYNAIPSGSKLRLALDSAFGVDVKPAIVKVGRARGVATYTPLNVTTGATYGFTIAVADGASLVVSYVAGVGDDAQDVVTALQTAVNLDTNITDHVTLAVVGTGTAAVLTVTPDTGTDDFTMTAFVGTYTLTGLATEAAGDTVNAIGDFDTKYTFVTSTDHRPSYQAALMAAVNVAVDKMYFTSSALAENYGSWDGVTTPAANNVSGVAHFNNYQKACVQYHNLADTVYPEMATISKFSWMEPGLTDWQYKSIPALSLAQIANGSRPLNTSELIQLSERYSPTVVELGGSSVIGGYRGLGNRMADGTRIEQVHWGIKTAHKFRQILQTKFLKSNKVAFNDNDLNGIKGILQSYLDTQVSSVAKTFALRADNPFKIIMPKAKDISYEDQVSGVLSGIEVICYTDASIGAIDVGLTITFLDPNEV